MLICDCGGGTVDIVTYLVTSTSPLKFEELIEGQGAKVGSTYIDRQFHLWLASRFGLYFETLEYRKKGPGSKLMREFELLKRDFGGSRNKQDVYEAPLVLKYQSCDHYDADEAVVKFTK